MSKRSRGFRFSVRLIVGGMQKIWQCKRRTPSFVDSTMPADLYPSRAPLFDGALAVGVPAAYRAILIASGRERRFQKRLLLPFVENGPAADLILAMAFASKPAPGEPPTLEKYGIVEIMVAQRNDWRVSEAA